MISWFGNKNFRDEMMNGTGLGMGFGGGDGYGPGMGYSGGYDAITAPLFGPGKLVITHTTRSFSVNYIHGETGTFDSNGYQMLYEAAFSYHHTYSFFNNDGIGEVDWGSFNDHVVTPANGISTIFYAGAKFAGKDVSKAIGSKALSETIKNAKLYNITSKVGTGLSAVGMIATYANYKLGNVSEGRYYAQQAINVVGLFGPWGAVAAMGLTGADAMWGDDIESWIRE